MSDIRNLPCSNYRCNDTLFLRRHRAVICVIVVQQQ